MKRTEHIKRLSVAHANLLSAAKRIDVLPPSSVPYMYVGIANVDSDLNEIALSEWIQELAMIGEKAAPRASFWRDLGRAADSLGRTADASAYEQRFHLALRNAP